MPINTLLEKYDIFYRQADGSELGFMLGKNRQGAKLWGREDQRGLPESFAPGDISYSNLSPDIQKVISHRYYHGGLGVLEFEMVEYGDYQVPRYLRSQNVDCRCRGKAYPGPKIVSLPKTDKNNVPTIVNADMELETGWDYSDGTVTRSNVRNHTPGGTFSLRINNPAASTTVRQYLEGWTPGVQYTFTCYIYGSGDVNQPAKIGIADGTQTQWCAAEYSTAAWADKTAQITLPSNAKYLCLLLYFEDGSGTDSAYFDDASITMDDSSGAFSYGAPSHQCVFNDKKYINFNKILARLNDAGTGYLTLWQFDNSITHLAVLPDNLFIALGGANKYWYLADFPPTGITENGLGAGTGETADRFCKVGTDLWQVVLPNKMRKTSDPVAGPWGGEILCDEAAYNVNDMWAHDDKLYCMKEDGPYYESGGAFYPAFPELATIAHADSGKNSTVFRDGLYFRMGNQQEWELKSSTLTERTPEIYAPGIKQYAYPCVARAHDESWLYTIIKRGANDLAILAGREEYIEGSGLEWVWHEIRSIDLTDVATAFVCSVEGRPYLYLGSTLSTENVYKVYLPITNDATADAGYRFHKAGAGLTAGSLWTPRYMTMLFAINKRWVEEYLRSENLSATNYINVNYSTDDGGSFDLLKKFITSPEQTEAFTNIEATMMNLQFDFIADSETVPPVLKYHNLKALTLMPSVTRFYHTIKCADGLRLKKNHVASPNYTSAVIETFLDSIRDKVVTLGDRRGTEHTVRVRVSRGEEVFDEDTKRPEMVHAIEAVKV